MLRSFSRSAGVLLALALLAGCTGKEEPVEPAAGQPDSNQTAQFRQFLDDYYAIDMARYPARASYRGIKTRHDQWDSVAEAFLQETRTLTEQRLAELESFDREALNGRLQLSYDIYKLTLERELASDDFRHHKFVIQQFRGPHSVLPSYLINIHRVTDVSDARAYIGRLNNAGGWFDQVIEQMQIRQDKGLLLADWQYPQIISAAGNVISGEPFDDSGVHSTLWADFSRKLAALELDKALSTEMREQARRALLEVVGPAYRRLIAALETQALQASADDGVWKFPDGEDFYAERLRWFTTTDLSATEIHQLGLREVHRIHGQMRAIMKQQEYEGELPDFFSYLRQSPEFYFPDTDAGRAAYLAEASELIRVMASRLPEMFGLRPRATLIVKRVEAFRERSAGKAFYQGPPADGSRPGIYYANLHDMALMPKYQMEALAYHEGVPGHHMQRAIAVELEDLPEFQKYASFTAYSEGWGLYSEELPLEMGFYSDPYSNFGRLAMELWRACRLVVDTGIHSKRWTRQAAIDYLMLNTPNPKGDVIKAIERYIAMPGQATAYMIGKLKILELRQRAADALGEQFDLRRFHDVILEDGPVPLSLLERKVDAMIMADQET